MSFDCLVLAAVREELQQRLAGARVQRVFEIGKNEAVLHLHHRGRVEMLLLSGDAQHARVHLTSRRQERPEAPSPFCMLLRKYLVGGRIREFRQLHLERVLEIDFDPPEAMRPVKLVAEIMGRRSNLLLVDEKNVILGAVKTASWEQNPKRAVQPGEPYRPVPPQDKLDPLAVQPEELEKALDPLMGGNGNPEKALVRAVRGLSPLAARELLHRSRWDPGAPWPAAQRLAGAIRELFAAAAAGQFKPVLAERLGLYAAYSLTHLPASELQTYASINELLDEYYDRLIRREKTTNLRNLLNSRVSHRLARLEMTLHEQQQELASAEDAPLYRLYGETLLTYAGQVPRGASLAVLPHLYRPEETLEIPLDPALSAQDNSRKYFQRYRKAQKAQEIIAERIKQTREEIDYCRALLYTIENGDGRSLEEIRQELVEAGYLREKKKKGPKKELPPQPLIYKTSSGRTILVGQNNRQ
ncbi:MAG TPA: NFACT family protein, partial [Bacillota bacterium]|nr:NFACT family protein [Bacillota bacterium]